MITQTYKIELIVKVDAKEDPKAELKDALRNLWINLIDRVGGLRIKTYSYSIESIDSDDPEYKFMQGMNQSFMTKQLDRAVRENKMAQPSEQFAGDMSRNEVEIDLNKFMAMVSEIGELKAKIMEMEMAQEPENPWQRYIWFSQMVDAYRIFPRAFLSVYMYLLYYTTFWFMDLPEPSFEQSGLISIVVGAGAAWFGLYAGTAKDKINSK